MRSQCFCIESGFGIKSNKFKMAEINSVAFAGWLQGILISCVNNIFMGTEKEIQNMNIPFDSSIMSNADDSASRNLFGQLSVCFGQLSLSLLFQPIRLQGVSSTIFITFSNITHKPFKTIISTNLRLPMIFYIILT